MHRAHKRRAMKHTPAQCTTLTCAQPGGQHWNATHAALLWLPRAAHAPSRGRYHVHHSLHQRAGDSTAVPKGPVVTWATTSMATIRSLGHLLRHTTPPTGRRHPHTHVRRRVFGQVPSSCCSPPPPVKAGRAPKPCIDTAGAARPACTTTACGGLNHDTRTPHAGGARDSRSTMRPARCQATPCPTNAARQPPSRVVGSATSVAPPHTHQRRGTTIHAQRAQRAQPE